jgi:hypothetical protein
VKQVKTVQLIYFIGGRSNCIEKTWSVGLEQKNDKTWNKNETPLILAFAAFVATTGVFSGAARPPLVFRVAFTGVALEVMFRSVVLLTGVVAARINSGF